ncbi:unannotated protein [freshwater metagenome]|uniref:Unannotated protein n=1 Tax=freshwater metagenome TaxID=449393 RepID=A0A6J6FV28_9ZZZZ
MKLAPLDANSGTPASFAHASTSVLGSPIVTMAYTSLSSVIVAQISRLIACGSVSATWSVSWITGTTSLPPRPPPALRSATSVSTISWCGTKVMPVVPSAAWAASWLVLITNPTRTVSPSTPRTGSGAVVAGASVVAAPSAAVVSGAAGSVVTAAGSVVAGAAVVVASSAGSSVELHAPSTSATAAAANAARRRPARRAAPDA